MKVSKIFDPIMSCLISLQWGVAFCVRGGPEKEKLTMQVFDLIDASIQLCMK